MSLIIQKFGGTSVADVDCIHRVADIVARTRADGHEVVVIVSAMSGETNRLIDLAHSVTPQPNPRELDALVATGEQVSSSLLAIALHKLGISARSFNAAQAQIKTDSRHKKARIVNIHTDGLRVALHDQQVPVVTGFQGVDQSGDITTLGRGGSDITAVALAAALNADECQIYTDVDGVYTSDPRVVNNARRLSQITYQEMLEFASQGAKVLQMRAVKFAEKYNVPLRVLSTFSDSSGTLIAQQKADDSPMVAGIAMDRYQAKLTMQGMPNMQGMLSKIREELLHGGIDADMLMQNLNSSSQSIDISFTVAMSDYSDALALTEKFAKRFEGPKVLSDRAIAKLSVVGAGMKSHPGTAHRLLEALGSQGIDVHLIYSSSVKVSVVIEEKYLEMGARLLHDAFELDRAVETKSVKNQ